MPVSRGTTALVATRHATELDVDDLVAMHGRCSPDTLHRRFHAPLHRVSPRLVRDLVSPPGGWSVLAEQHGVPVAHGVAGMLYPGVVEVGLLVEDGAQGAGIGSRLVGELAAEATDRGFRDLVCLAQGDHESIVATVRSAGLDCVAALHDELLEVVVPLHAQPVALMRVGAGPQRSSERHAS